MQLLWMYRMKGSIHIVPFLQECCAAYVLLEIFLTYHRLLKLHRRISEEAITKVSVIWITHATIVILIICIYPIIGI